MSQIPAPLADLRARINAVDTAIVDLLAQRRRIVAEVGAFKRAHGLPGPDPAREAELLALLCNHADAQGLPRQLVEDLWAVILAHGRNQVRGP